MVGFLCFSPPGAFSSMSFREEFFCGKALQRVGVWSHLDIDCFHDSIPVRMKAIIELSRDKGFGIF